MRCLLDIVAIHEDVLPTRVAMQVTVHHYLPLFHEGPHHSLDSKVDRVELLVGCLPTPIQILATQRASVVSVDDSIWVQDRDDLEDKRVSKGLSLCRVSCQKIDDSFHHPRRIGFSRMHSGRYDDAFLGFGPLAVWVFVARGDDQVLALVAGQRTAQRCSVEEILARGILLNSGQVLLQVRISVRKAMRVEHRIVLMLIRHSKSEGVEVSGISNQALPIPLEVVSIVVDLFTNSVPA